MSTVSLSTKPPPKGKPWSLWSVRELAMEFGISEQATTKWLRNHPEFTPALTIKGSAGRKARFWDAATLQQMHELRGT